MTDLEKLKKITGEKDEELLQLLLEDLSMIPCADHRYHLPFI